MLRPHKAGATARCCLQASALFHPDAWVLAITGGWLTQRLGLNRVLVTLWPTYFLTMINLPRRHGDTKAPLVTVRILEGGG